MAAVIHSSFNVANARNFRNSLNRVSPDPEILYMTIGRNFTWPLDSNGEAPSTPLDTIEDEILTRESIIGMKRISFSDTCLVAPRHDWTTGTVYDEYAPDDPALFSKEFYVLTDDNNVYKCISNNNGAQSTVKPTGTSTTTITTADGYQWKFMYDVPSSLVLSFLTTDWVPVPTGGNRSALQLAVEGAASFVIANSGTVGTPIGGHGYNASEELGAFYVMFTKKFENSEGGILPVDDDYRQISLWLNPLFVGGTAIDGQIYNSTSDSTGEIDFYSGRIIFTENRAPIVRAADQNETLALIIEF